MTRAAILILAIALGGCSAQTVIGAGYLAAQLTPRGPNTFVCKPPRIERNGICARPETWKGYK